MQKAIELEWVSANRFRIVNQRARSQFFLPARIKVDENVYVRICSSAYPAFCETISYSDMSALTLFTRGTSYDKDDLLVYPLPSQEVGYVKKAVDIYNELIEEGAVYLFAADGSCEKKKLVTGTVFTTSQGACVEGLGFVVVDSGPELGSRPSAHPYFADMNWGAPVYNTPVVTLYPEPPPFWVVNKAGPNCATPSRVIIRKVEAGSTLMHIGNGYCMCRVGTDWYEFSKLAEMVKFVAKQHTTPLAEAE